VPGTALALVLFHCGAHWPWRSRQGAAQFLGLPFDLIAIGDRFILASDKQTIFNDKLDRLSVRLRLIQLTAEDFDIGWSDDAERNSVALDLDDFHSDVAVDNQLIINFAT
jgi:hypothetical protein